MYYFYFSFSEHYHFEPFHLIKAYISYPTGTESKALTIHTVSLCNLKGKREKVMGWISLSAV